MQRINEWEIYYLLSVDPYKFVENLATKHFFYDLISKDFIRDNSSAVVSIRSDYDVGSFNNVSIILIYNCITNIINDNINGALNSRHSYFKNSNSVDTIKQFTFQCKIENYRPDSTAQVYNLRLFSMTSYWDSRYPTSIQINADTTSIYEHEIIITNIDNNFFTTIILMYQDFIDNIPMPTI